MSAPGPVDKAPAWCGSGVSTRQPHGKLSLACGAVGMGAAGGAGSSDAGDAKQAPRERPRNYQLLINQLPNLRGA